MILDFFQNATVHIVGGFANTLFNGFDSDISEEDKVSQVGLNFAHFKPINRWSVKEYTIVDLTTGTNTAMIQHQLCDLNAPLFCSFRHCSNNRFNSKSLE